MTVHFCIDTRVYSKVAKHPKGSTIVHSMYTTVPNTDIVSVVKLCNISPYNHIPQNRRKQLYTPKFAIYMAMWAALPGSVEAIHVYCMSRRGFMHLSSYT